MVTRKGKVPIHPTERKYKGANIIGGIDGYGNVVFQILEKKSGADSFLEFLEYLHHFNGYGSPHVILDNIYFHKAKRVLEFAKENNMTLHFQPTHSPHVNAAEEIWRQLRQWLRGRLFFTMKKLKEAILEFFVNFPKLNIKIVNYLS